MPYADRDRQVAYQNKWLKQRRLDWLAANGPCVDCGSWVELEVDHVDPEQKITHRVWGWCAARREAELAKCVARCSPCHKRKSCEQSWARRYCPQGHDTTVVGRDKKGTCRECKRVYDRTRRRR